MKSILLPTLGFALCACGTDPTEADPQAAVGPCELNHYVTDVVDYEFGDGQNFGQTEFPENILGPPQGGGEKQGSLHVTSLGNGGWVIVSFEGTRIVDGPGTDFIVFENAFLQGDDAEHPFAELATVSVSDDGEDFVEFECSAVSAPFGECAGWRPVLANPEENDIDPLDPETAGGDPYDLSNVGLSSARFVKIVDREDLTGSQGVFDLDAVAIVHGACE